MIQGLVASPAPAAPAPPPRAPAGAGVGSSPLDRIAAFADQAVVSAANLLLTLLLARGYEPVCLAAFAIGSSLALVLQGVYRSAFVLPASLLGLGVFRARVGRLLAQHVIVVGGAVAATAAGALLAARLVPTPLGVRAAAATAACVPLFISVDFDRVLTLRLGRRLMPLALACGYLLLVGGLAAFSALRGAPPFFALMAVLGAFSLGRTAFCAGRLARPEFRGAGAFARVNFRRNAHWGLVSNLAAGGYAVAPVLLLGWWAPALNVAAFNAMRNLTQPLQLALRSLDIVDKLVFSTLDRSDPAGQRAHVLFVATLYLALSAAFALLMALVGGALAHLAFASRYDGFGGTLVIWSVTTGLTGCLAPFETVIYRTNRLKHYALVQLVGALCALAVAPSLIGSFSDLGAVTTVLLGTGIVFAGLVALCAPFLRPARPANAYEKIHAPRLGRHGTGARPSKGARMLDSSTRRPPPGLAPVPGRDAPAAAPAAADDAAHFFAVLRERRRGIAACALSLPAAVVALTILVPFRYTSWAEVGIDPRGQKTTEADIVPSGYGNDIAISDSQIKIITSDAVLLPVVRELRLADDPDFGPSFASNLVGNLGAMLGRPPAPGEGRELEALRALRQRVTARRAERTYILDIGASARSPERAAELARAVTDSYLADHQRAEATTVRSVAGFLSSRLDELRSSLVAAEKGVEDYKEAHDLVTVKDVQLTEQQLADLQLQLAAASARVAQAQARLDAVGLVRAGKGDPGALTAALNSPVVNELRKQAAEAGRSEAMMAATLGRRHPALNEAHQQTARIRAMINDELGRIYAAAGADLAIARGDEAALKTKIAALQAATVSTNRALVGLRQLEREVDARRGTYKAFLSRSEAAEEQGDAPVTNLRVLTPAGAPDRRDGPGRAVLALAALLMGALIGVGQALFRDRLAGRAGPGWPLRRALEAGAGRDNRFTASP